MIDISLDLETWGLLPGSDIRSIGAVVFDPATGTVSDNTFYRATFNPAVGGTIGHNPPIVTRHFDLSRDRHTEKWWSQQSEEAQAAFANPVLLDAALRDLAYWMAELGTPENIRLWSHGAHFDEPILRVAYDRIGANGGQTPWHYRSPRDTRTIFEAAGMDPTNCLENYARPGDVYHHALHDARVQAQAICAAYARIRGDA